MWHLVKWVSGGHGSVELMVGVDDLRVFSSLNYSLILYQRIEYIEYIYSISKIVTKGETLSCTGAEHQQVQILSHTGAGSKGGQCQDMKEWGQSLGGTLHRSRCPTAKGRETGDWAIQGRGVNMDRKHQTEDCLVGWKY